MCPQAEYATCPGALILNHFFEDASPLSNGDTVQTKVTLIPCTEDLRGGGTAAQTSTVAQLLIFNEFEQRFSSSTRVQCLKSIRLADIDTRVGTGDNATSIFAVGVQGTLTGQTRVRGVPSDQNFHGLLGVAEEIYDNGFSNAFNLHYDGTRGSLADIITIQ